MPSHRLKGLGFVKTTRGVSADLDCSFCPPIRGRIPIDRDESSRKREHMFYTFLKHEYVPVESFLAKIWRSFFLEMNHTLGETHARWGLPRHTARCRWAIAADVAVASRLGEVAKKNHGAFSTRKTRFWFLKHFSHFLTCFIPIWGVKKNTWIQFDGENLDLSAARGPMPCGESEWDATGECLEWPFCVLVFWTFLKTPQGFQLFQPTSKWKKHLEDWFLDPWRLFRTSQREVKNPTIT